MCPAWSLKPSLGVTPPGKASREKTSPQPAPSLTKPLQRSLSVSNPAGPRFRKGRAGAALRGLLPSPGRAVCLGAVPLCVPLFWGPELRGPFAP